MHRSLSLTSLAERCWSTGPMNGFTLHYQNKNCAIFKVLKENILMEIFWFNFSGHWHYLWKTPKPTNDFMLTKKLNKYLTCLAYLHWEEILHKCLFDLSGLVAPAIVFDKPGWQLHADAPDQWLCNETKAVFVLWKTITVLITQMYRTLKWWTILRRRIPLSCIIFIVTKNPRYAQTMHSVQL